MCFNVYLYAAVANTGSSSPASITNSYSKSLSDQQSQSPLHLCLEGPFIDTLVQYTQ